MEIKSNKIKSMNDFVCGILLTGLGIWLVLSKNVTEGRILKAHDQGFIRPDSYIRIIGWLIIILAVIIAVRAINFKREKETSALWFRISKESFLSFVALGLFIFFLPRLGFAISTFVFGFFTVTLYMLKETEHQGFNRRQKIKRILFSAVFSIALVLLIYLVFTKILLVVLP